MEQARNPDPIRLNVRVIFEGPHICYKTSLVRRIVETKHVSHLSGEWPLKWQPVPPADGRPNMIDPGPHSEHLGRDAFETVGRLLRTFPYQSFVIDRFHLSRNYLERKYSKPETDFSWLEEMLAELGTIVVLCFRDPESYLEAVQQRLSETHHAINFYPATRDAYLEDLSIFRDLVASSRLPHVEVDTTSGDIPRIASELEATVRLLARRMGVGREHV